MVQMPLIRLQLALVKLGLFLELLDPCARILAAASVGICFENGGG